VTDLAAEDLWHIGNTRRPQFTAHYLARSPLHLAFPSVNVIHRRVLSFLRLESFILSFFRHVYFDSCTIFSAIFCFFLFLLFRTPILSILPYSFFIFIPTFSSFFFFFSFFFLAFYSVFFSYTIVFIPFSFSRDLSSLLIFSAIFILFYFYLFF